MEKIKGINGPIRDVASLNIPENLVFEDFELKNMAEWAMNYLMRSPKPEYNYQPVFQVFPLRFPSFREVDDPVVDCDTDARMDWEWYYMRDIVKDERGKDVEEKFHERMRGFIREDGLAIAHPGCYHENLENAVYGEADKIIHVWGTVKILNSLSEEYIRTKNNERLVLAGKVYIGLRDLFIWGEDENGRFCYAPNGMGPVDLDFKKGNKQAWGSQPAPVVGPLLKYYEASGNTEAIDFARAAANGIMYGKLPGSIRFYPNGGFGIAGDDGILESGRNVGHSHGTMKAVWGICELGLLTGESVYIEFAKRSFDWMMSRGTGTGWFPAGPDNCNETCAISDMISVATCLGLAGYAEYFDYAERFFRNYILNLQFILTPEMKDYYRCYHKGQNPEDIERQLELLTRVQGAIIGGSGINDFENDLLGNVSGFSIFGCCAPEGMRAVHTVWSRAAVMKDGILWVNMPFNLEKEWGTVKSYAPSAGGLQITTKQPCNVRVRVAHWADKQTIKIKLNDTFINPKWDGDYLIAMVETGGILSVTWPLVCFKHTSQVWKVSAPDLKVSFTWEGNRVVGCEPEANEGKIPLFHKEQRRIPEFR